MNEDLDLLGISPAEKPSPSLASEPHAILIGRLQKTRQAIKLGWVLNLDALDREMADAVDALALTRPDPSLGGREAEVERLKAAMAKIDAIRDSIVGCQNVNWSEHIYPLVAALGEAGYEGAEYETARANIGTLIEQTKAADARAEAAEAALAALSPPSLGMEGVQAALSLIEQVKANVGCDGFNYLAVTIRHGRGSLSVADRRKAVSVIMGLSRVEEALASISTPGKVGHGD